MFRSAHNRSTAPARTETRADTLEPLTPLIALPIAGRRNVRSDMRWQRPETHQNLIHPDKEQHPAQGRERYRERGLSTQHQQYR